MTQKHSPGPWEWRWTDKYTAGFGAAPELWSRQVRILYANIAGIVSGVRICSDAPDDEQKANANLITAAPELLAALVQLVPEGAGTKECDCGCGGGEESDNCDYADALAAIAKAEGRVTS
jgi:hypothetical protein